MRAKKQQAFERVFHRVDEEARIAPLVADDTPAEPSFEPISSEESNGNAWLPSAAKKAPRPPKDMIYDHGLEVGQVVVGQVVWESDRGQAVELQNDTRIRGFCPHSQRPMALRNTIERNAEEDIRMTQKTVREFQILKVPDACELRGRGPLLSARQYDSELIWQRAEQLGQLSRQENEPLTLTIHQANSGGLLSVLEGIVIFIPVSRVPKPRGTHLTLEDLQRDWVGKEVSVQIEIVDVEQSKVVGRIVPGRSKDVNLRVGQVVQCTVASVKDFGAFMAIDDTAHQALLHVSNISRVHVDTPHKVFQVGDPVSALIIGMERNYTRISLSTAELESEDGMMVENPEEVYANAEQNAQDFRQYFEELQASGKYVTGEVTRRRKRAPREDRFEDFGGGGGDLDWE
ncbi:hypothetical protein WJX73_002326 [Symbiochloris irregularis]|uniref:S1 motif domain-containing protein n=1 Tax=Symbiochloris irregularis TaxID=706552 RepID=A0AAW1PB51_9CHLO